MLVNKKLLKKFKRDIRLSHRSDLIWKLDNVFKITSIKITKVTPLLRKEAPLNIAKVDYRMRFNILNPISWIIIVGILIVESCVAVVGIFLDIISNDEYSENLYFNKEDLEDNSQK